MSLGVWVLAWLTALAGCVVGGSGRRSGAGPYAQEETVPEGAAPQCRMGAGGQQACGYHCAMGADGVMACADTENGSCAMGSNGRVTCSHVGRGHSGRSQAPTECRMGTDGQNVCGYHCQMGTNGHIYCSATPNGHCAMNSNGTFSCP
jgi:hypothetical protein